MIQNFNMRVPAARLAAIVLIAAAALCAACSTVRFGYNSADSIAYWWLDRYVGFDAGQRPWVKKELQGLLAWHRATQLGNYSLLLAQEQVRLAQAGIAEPDLMADYAVAKKYAWLLIDKALPDMADLALSLTPRQISRIEARFADNNEEYRKKYLSGDMEERQRRRYEKTLKQAEYWFGDLSEAQRRKFRQAVDSIPMNYELWMEERMQRQRDLIELLRKIQARRPAREATQAMLREYIAGFDRDYSEISHEGQGHRAFFDAYRAAVLKTTAMMVNMATPEQKKHAASRLQKWREDFNALAAAG